VSMCSLPLFSCALLLFMCILSAFIFMRLSFGHVHFRSMTPITFHVLQCLERFYGCHNQDNAMVRILGNKEVAFESVRNPFYIVGAHMSHLHCPISCEY
jgi:hypothetical protein